MSEGGWWHVRQGAFHAGPITATAVEDLIEWGRLGATALVWRSDLPDWAPISAHFSLPDQSDQRPVDPPAPIPPPLRPSFGWARVVGLIASSVLVWVGAGAIVFLFVYEGLLEHSASTAAVLWAAAGLGTAAALVVSVTLWLRLWSRLAGRYSELGGVLSIGAVILSLPVAVVAAVQLMQTDFIRRQVAEASTYAYEITAEPKTRTITVWGGIGPGFARELASKLETVDGPPIVVITSDGGLVTEALKAARDLQARPGAQVIAHEQCDSACIIVLMAGEDRFADEGVSLGFHAGSFLVEGGMTKMLDPKEADAEANDYLVSRGVPRRYLDRAAAMGPEKLLHIDAADLVKDGALTGLMTHGGGETEPAAKAR